jgi:hypothetical protein
MDEAIVGWARSHVEEDLGKVVEVGVVRLGQYYSARLDNAD